MLAAKIVNFSSAVLLRKKGIVANEVTKPTLSGVILRMNKHV